MVAENFLSGMVRARLQCSNGHVSDHCDLARRMLLVRIALERCRPCMLNIRQTTVCFRGATPFYSCLHATGPARQAARTWWGRPAVGRCVSVSELARSGAVVARVVVEGVAADRLPA